MTSVSIDSRGRIHLRGPNGKFGKPKTNEEHKMIEEARKQFAKENKISRVSRTESAGKKKLSNKREQFKSADSHSPKSPAKHESLTTSRKLKISDIIPLTRSKSLAIALDIKFKVLRLNSKRRLSSAKSKTSIRSDSLSQTSQNSQVNTVSASNRSSRPNKSDKKSVSEDQSSQAKSVSDLKRSAHLAANLSKTPVKHVQSKAVRHRSSSTKSKSSIHLDSENEKTQSTQSNSTAASRLSVHLTESEKSHRSKKSTKRIQLKDTLLNVSDLESDNENFSSQASSAVTPKCGARLTDKKSSYYSLKFTLSLTKAQNDS